MKRMIPLATATVLVSFAAGAMIVGGLAFIITTGMWPLYVAGAVIFAVAYRRDIRRVLTRRYPHHHDDGHDHAWGDWEPIDIDRALGLQAKCGECGAWRLQGIIPLPDGSLPLGLPAVITVPAETLERALVALKQQQDAAINDRPLPAGFQRWRV